MSLPDLSAVQVSRIGRADPASGSGTREEETVLLLHGPTSNLFGERDPAYYGTYTLDDIERYATECGKRLGLKVICAQDNWEGALVEHLHAARRFGAIVCNPNALQHYSYSIRDALETIKTPYIEIHMSNMHARSEHNAERAKNVTAAAGKGYICGCGILGYKLAIERARWLIDEKLAKEGKMTAKARL
ncbi:type II 3-dehydroquinate dehydratase [Meredithblackwellia eburnea MCA 4105]